MKLNRRDLIKSSFASCGALAPLLSTLPSVAGDTKRRSSDRRRLILMFSPNGTVVNEFWPNQIGKAFEFKRILAPLDPYKQNTLVMKGIHNSITGIGDRHMRGMSCLLTGVEMAPGNIQGGSDRPAGWAGGISIDQQIKTHLQADESTNTRFGTLEHGVLVPNRADPWTRWIYAGKNQPIAPISSPYLMFEKLYGRVGDQDTLASVLDLLTDDLKSMVNKTNKEDRDKLDRHLTFVREMEKELQSSRNKTQSANPPELPMDVDEENDNMPKLSKMQMNLLVNGLASNSNRIASLQFTKAVGNARMNWLGIQEGHHQLSHDPDLEKKSQEKLVKINTWFAEQIAYLIEQLKATPEPEGEGSLFDHTLIVWGNELGKGNSHTLKNIPFVAIAGERCSWQMGRSLRFKGVPHNRLLVSIANEMGLPIKTFGKAQLSKDGPLDLA